MPYNRRTALGPSQWERRVYASRSGVLSNIGSNARLAAYAARQVLKNNARVRNVAREVNKYIPKKYKSTSTLSRKMGPKMSYKSSKTMTASTGVSKPLEGQSLTIAKTIRMNLGGKGQVKALSPAVRHLWNKCRLRLVLANRQTINSGLGYNLLSNFNDGVLPLHCYELTHIPFLDESSFTHQHGLLNQSGNWVANSGTSSFLDVVNGIDNASAFEHCTHWLHHFARVKLLLYGRAKQSTTYRIMFFRAKSEDSCPLHDATHNKAFTQQQIWLRRLAPYTTNPVFLGHDSQKFRGDKGNDIIVLRQFDYTIKEQLSTEDVINKHSVSFTCYFNKIKSHVNNNAMIPNVTDITLTMPPQAGTQNQTAYNAARSPLHNQRVYMAIFATAYESSGETNYSEPSYDIAIDQTLSAAVTHGWPHL